MSQEKGSENSDSTKNTKAPESGKKWDWLKSASSIAAIIGLFATLVTFISSNNQLKLEDRKFFNSLQTQYFERINQNNGVKNPTSELRLFKSIEETADNESIRNWAQSEMVTLKTLSDIEKQVQVASFEEIKAREFAVKSDTGAARSKAMLDWTTKREHLKNLMNEFVFEGGAKFSIQLANSPWDEDTRDENIYAKQIQNNILRAQLESLQVDIIKKKKELGLK